MGQIVNRANGASLAFHFPKGKGAIPIEVHAAGQVVSGRLLLVHDPSSSTEFDMRFLIDVEERVMQKPSTGHAELAREPDIDRALQTMGRTQSPPTVSEADVEVLTPARTEVIQGGVSAGDGSSAFGIGAVLVEPVAATVPAQRAEPSDGLPPFPVPGETSKQPDVHLVKDGFPPPPPPRPAAGPADLPRMARDLNELQAEANRDWR